MKKTKPFRLTDDQHEHLRMMKTYSWYAERTRKDLREVYQDQFFFDELKLSAGEY